MRRSGVLRTVSIVGFLIAGCSGVNKPSENGSGGGASSSVSLALSPTSATVTVGQSTLFQATVTGSANTAVTWEVNGTTGGNTTYGTINGGQYVAPTTAPSPATVTVTAVAQASASASQSAAVLIVPSTPNQEAQSLPIKLGTSGGNAKDSSTQGNLISCCGGTLGSLLQRDGIYYILSNNHVLARSDSASIGEDIIQPGLINANCMTAGTTTVANLSQFVNLQATGTNVDAAIAEIVPGTVDTGGNILSLGATATGGTPDPGAPHAGSGITASIGESVAKSGRTSGLTCSSVGAIDVQDSVSYQSACGGGMSFSVTYTGQVSVSGGSFSTFGDSGSLIVDQNTADPVALLYGGSDTDTVGHPVADVLTALADSQGNPPSFVGSATTHNVIGCTLAQNMITTTSANMLIPAGQLALAQRARDMHAPELLANPYVQAVGVGPSIDHPGEAAVVIVVDPDQIPTAIPNELDGVATRIVRGGLNGPHGIFDMNTAVRIAPVIGTFAVNAISKAEFKRAETVNAVRANALMKQPGVQGVGVTSSANAPGEAALMIFVIRGVPRNPIPVTIDGLRTRVRESSRFTAGHRGNEAVLPGCRVPPNTPANSQQAALTQPLLVGL
jgi:hypothetical protein